MYFEKLTPILNDIENKDIDVAGGSVVSMVLSITNSLINYICNLTKDKKKYEDVRDKVIKLQEQSQKLQQKNLIAIDKDEEILRKMLKAYKNRKEEPEKLEPIYRKSAEFCVSVTENALETLKLAEQISKIGNQMLASDFKICILYAYTSVEASLENVKININSITDEEYRNKLQSKCDTIYEEAKILKGRK